MPLAPPRPCTKSGCPKYAASAGRCDDHQRDPWHGGASRHERGYGTRWDRKRKAILKRDSHLCQHHLIAHDLCIRATIVDHIVPKSEGGTDDNSNLISICKDCHKDKTSLESVRGRVRSNAIERAG